MAIPRMTSAEGMPHECREEIARIIDREYPAIWQAIQMNGHLDHDLRRMLIQRFNVLGADVFASSAIFKKEIRIVCNKFLELHHTLAGKNASMLSRPAKAIQPFKVTFDEWKAMNNIAMERAKQMLMEFEEQRIRAEIESLSKAQSCRHQNTEIPFLEKLQKDVDQWLKGALELTHIRGIKLL